MAIIYLQEQVARFFQSNHVSLQRPLTHSSWNKGINIVYKVLIFQFHPIQHALIFFVFYDQQGPHL